MNIESRLTSLGIVIPSISKPLAAYIPAVRTGNLIFTSGQLPMRDGQLAYQGKLGKDLSVEEGQAAAKQAALNCLAVLQDMIGDWDDIVQFVKVTGYIHSADDFFQQPAVLNGASQLLESIWGEAAKHSRAAIGTNALPLGAACEIEMVVQVK